MGSAFVKGASSFNGIDRQRLPKSCCHFGRSQPFLAVRNPITVAVVSVSTLKMLEFIQFFHPPHAGTALD
jgi:hypothetical protein